MPSGAPKHERVGPIPESPLYKSDPNQGSGSQSLQWNRLEREGYEPLSAGLDRSGTPWSRALLQE